jgi:hypothetical protein
MNAFFITATNIILYLCCWLFFFFFIYLPVTLSFSLLTCLTAKTSCINRFVANHDDIHPLFFFPLSHYLVLSLPIYRQYDHASGRSAVIGEREQKKDKCACVYTVGLVRMELKISTFYSLQ